MISNKLYNQAVAFHVGLGLIIYIIEPISLFFGLLLFFLGFFWILRNKNQNEEALLVCAYFMGVEVFLRMTKGTISHEFVKYSIMFFLLLGMFFKGFSKNALPYWIFMILLFPGIITGMIALSGEDRFRQILMFNLSGPLCLAIASIYCYNRKINMQHLMHIFWFIGLPIISCATYLVLYTPDIKEVLSHTGSNFETSGGYGPNQVSTILGLGLFVYFARSLFASPTRWQLLLNLAFSFFFTYRALLTFSRGGLLTGLIMVFILIVIVFYMGNSNAKMKILISISILGVAMFLIWLYTVVLTGGLIEKRYANQDAQGRDKESIASGREELALSEIELFLVDPYLGGGVGSGTVYRKQKFDKVMASHNEVTRMLGEHGLLGVLGLLLLILTPILLYLDNKNHFFLLSLLAFWFLTLNHAAMRTAAPAFVYALTLLKIQLDDPPVIPWKRRFGSSSQPHHTGNTGEVAEG